VAEIEARTYLGRPKQYI